MATTEVFNDMIKTYMPYDLHVEEMKKRMFFWNKVKKDTGWFGGTLDVPFEGGEYSSLSMGSLTASSDVANATEVLGTLSTMPELWGTLKFNGKDLDFHTEASLKKSFLKLLPNKLNQFIGRMSERTNLMLLNGAHIDKLSSDGANGSIIVYHPERFTIGEKISIDDDNSSAVDAYVTAIDVNTGTSGINTSGTLTIKDARSAGSAVDASAYTTAQNAKVYLPGSQSNGFTSLRGSLLSSTNGGDATLYGQTKTSFPALQALNIDGSDVTATNILGKTFDYFFDIASVGKGMKKELLCSYKNFKNMVSNLELNRNFNRQDQSAGYGFSSISLLGIGESMTITGLRDMDDDVMYVVDWDAMKFHGSHFFERETDPQGNQYFRERGTTGNTYLIDTKFYGDLVVSAPSHCGVIHSISY